MLWLEQGQVRNAYHTVGTGKLQIWSGAPPAASCTLGSTRACRPRCICIWHLCQTWCRCLHGSLRLSARAVRSAIGRRPAEGLDHACVSCIGGRIL